MIGKTVALIQVPNQRLFRMKSAAQYLGSSEDWLRDASDAGLITAYNLNSRRVFKLEDLDAFIDSLPEYQSYPYTDIGGKLGGKEKKNGN